MNPNHKRLIIQIAVFVVIVGAIVAIFKLREGRADPWNNVSVKMEMNISTLALRSNEIRKLICSYNGEEKTSLNWSSTDEQVATVDNKGNVTAVAPGTAEVRAISLDKKAGALTKIIVERQTPEALFPINPVYTAAGEGYTNAGSGNAATIMITGDLRCLAEQQKAAEIGDIYDFSASFSAIKATLAEADFVLGNLGTMLSDSWAYTHDEPARDDVDNYNAPATFLDALTGAGINAVASSAELLTAAGERGISETAANLERYGIIGTGFSTQKPYVLVEINGIKTAVLSWTCALDDDLKTSGLVNIYSASSASTAIADAKSAGAEYVIVYVNWSGKERLFNARSAEYAQEMADLGADCIIGSYDNALSRFDTLTASDGRKVPVAYSLGAFIGNGETDTALLCLELTKNGSSISAAVSYIPCYVYGFRTVGAFLRSDSVVTPLDGSTAQQRAIASRIDNLLGGSIPVKAR